MRQGDFRQRRANGCFSAIADVLVYQPVVWNCLRFDLRDNSLSPQTLMQKLKKRESFRPASVTNATRQRCGFFDITAPIANAWSDVTMQPEAATATTAGPSTQKNNYILL